MNISKEQFTKLAKEHLIALETYKMDEEGNKPVEIFGIEKLYEAITVTRCCKSDSELLPDLEKKKLIEDAYWLNLQNLSGREDFEEAFKLGIETGVDETLEKLQG